MTHTIFKCVRAVLYVTLVYTRAVGGIFYQSMNRMVNEVEHAAEMDRRASVLKKRQH